jgi:transcriptional regulator with PAS, ATPase and Fis domain
VRIVAATNQNLEQMVSERRFRMDLYYRPNVFPITIPPLRERPEDIPLPVAHFVRTFAGRQGKVIEHIPGDVMIAIESYNWPGNIRELQNVIERSVVLTRCTELRAPVPELTNRAGYAGRCGEGAYHSDPSRNQLGGRRAEWSGRQTRPKQDNTHGQNAKARNFASSSGTEYRAIGY